MGLGRGSHCFVWGSLAAVLYAGPANPEQDVATAAARVEVSAALADSDAAPTAPDLTAARDERDPDALLASPPVRIAVVTPEANANAREAADECVLSQECIDQYLWLIYDRARKLDTVKVKDRIKATVKKKGKTRTVTKTVTKLVDEDFTWKDPQAAEKAGMSMVQYVIGGMDRSFKLRLYRLFRAMDDAGLAPGMTSGFRDDYRQAIASGNKAASDSSFHGGSRRGGYGHGLAADVVSVMGNTRGERWISSEALWKWVDLHGKEFGIGRPYLDRDPPHIAPIDGQEYVAKRGVKVKRAGL